MAVRDCARDFNEVLNANEQIGGQGRTYRQMEGFREAVECCGFSDLGYIGLSYTWDNKQEDGSNIKVRLDRGLANPDFLNLFPVIKVWHAQTSESDHCCLVLECLQEVRSRRRRKRALWYENIWRRDPSYTHMVEAAWSSLGHPTTMSQFLDQLGSVAGAMKDWE